MTSITPIESPSLLAPIKTDLKGRLKLSNEHKSELLDAYENSGLSGIQFAKIHGLKYPTFISWVRKRKDQQRPGPYPSSFIEVDLDPDAKQESPLHITLPNGARIEVRTSSHIQLAAELLQNLNA